MNSRLTGNLKIACIINTYFIEIMSIIYIEDDIRWISTLINITMVAGGKTCSVSKTSIISKQLADKENYISSYLFTKFPLLFNSPQKNLSISTRLKR